MLSLAIKIRHNINNIVILSINTKLKKTMENCVELIEKIIELYLKGKIRSKQQISQMLAEGITQGMGEIFDRVLEQKIEETTAQLETKLKATRVLRALETIKKEWINYQKENQVNQTIATATQQIIATETNQQILTLLKIIDPNKKETLNRKQLTELAESLKNEPSKTEEINQLANGIIEGLKAFSQLEDHIINWIYEQNKSTLGFAQEKKGPWIYWEKKINSPLPKQLFQTLGEEKDITEISRKSNEREIAAWVELIILLQYLQKGLVTWFDKQPYDAKIGKKLSYTTLLSFSNIWAQLSIGFNQKNHLNQACFQVMLQILRTLAKRDDFPLYGGIFASFSGKYLQNALTYFDEPLTLFEGDQDKARLLALLGYSQRVLGNYQKAKTFHEEALEILSKTEDKPCFIAHLNHLCRIYIEEKEYSQAINYSQRALIFSRQYADRLGEANALVNLGYSKVFSAREIDSMDATIYQEAINYLEEGLQLAEKLGDRSILALGYNSLGIAYQMNSQPTAAIKALESAKKVAQSFGDAYLQGLNFAYLAEAYYSLENTSEAIHNGFLAMYLLNQIQSEKWRSSAGLLSIILGQIGTEKFQSILLENRPKIIRIIGVDGYDYLLELLNEYNNN